jgi:hypothetical protein
MASPQKRKRKKKAWISNLAARPRAEKGKNGEQMVSFEARKHSKECQKNKHAQFSRHAAQDSQTGYIAAPKKNHTRQK